MPAPKLYAVHDYPRPALQPATTAVGTVAGADILNRRIALLCGGHSLHEDWAGRREWLFDEIMAVNGAAFAFPCDYAIMTDSPLVRQIRDRTRKPPRVAIVTYQNAYKRTMDQVGVRCLQIPSMPPGCKSYTCPRALRFALTRCGPDGRIELFGVDFSSDPLDVAGIKGERSAKRWQQEAEALRAVWDKRVVAVHGRIRADRLDFIRGTLPKWPG